jgi:hypothetical protein
MDARLTILVCKQIIVAKSEGVKTGSNLAEYSKEGYGSKRAVLASICVSAAVIQLCEGAVLHFR